MRIRYPMVVTGGLVAVIGLPMTLEACERAADPAPVATQPTSATQQTITLTTAERSEMNQRRATLRRAHGALLQAIAAQVANGKVDRVALKPQWDAMVAAKRALIETGRVQFARRGISPSAPIADHEIPEMLDRLENEGLPETDAERQELARQVREEKLEMTIRSCHEDPRSETPRPEAIKARHALIEALASQVEHGSVDRTALEPMLDALPAAGVASHRVAHLRLLVTLMERKTASTTPEEHRKTAQFLRRTEEVRNQLDHMRFVLGGAR